MGYLGLFITLSKATKTKWKNPHSFHHPGHLPWCFYFPTSFTCLSGGQEGEGVLRSSVFDCLQPLTGSALSPWEQLYSGTCFIPQVKAKCSSVRRRGTQIQERKAAWKSSYSSLSTAEVRSGYVRPCVHWYWWVQRARRGKGAGWWHGALRDLQRLKSIQHRDVTRN